MKITEEMIARINVLAKKAKEGTLSEDEVQERKELRQAYIAAFRGNFESQLNSITVVDQKGNTSKLSKKEKKLH